jgi:hypothetical protein
MALFDTDMLRQNLSGYTEINQEVHYDRKPHTVI